MTAAFQPAPLDLSHAALIGADLQRDFLRLRGEMDDAAIAATVETCRKLMAHFRAHGRPVVLARTVFRADGMDCAWGPDWTARMFGTVRGLLADGTPGADWIDGIVPESRDIVLTKAGHSAFFGTPLDRILGNFGVRDLLLTGGPVASTLSDTARNGAALGYRVHLARDAVYPPLATYPLGSAAQAINSTDVLNAASKVAAPRKSHDVFIIIDMQNHFLFPARGTDEVRRGHALRNGALVDRVARLAATLRTEGWQIVWIKTGRRADRIDTAMHRLREEILLDADGLLIDGTPAAALADGLVPAPEDLVLAKRGQSAFSFTPLHRVLRNLSVGRCLLAGGAASGCLGATLRDGAALGYRFTVVRDAVYPVDSPYLPMLADHAALCESADLLGPETLRSEA